MVSLQRMVIARYPPITPIPLLNVGTQYQCCCCTRRGTHTSVGPGSRPGCLMRTSWNAEVTLPCRPCSRAGAWWSGAPAGDDHALPTPGQRSMHYPQLESTTCVSAGIIAIGAVVGNWLGVRSSSRAITCWMGCLTCTSCACRRVWSAAAMLPRQPCSRSGAWSAVPHPRHGKAGCDRFDHRVGQAYMRYLRVEV
ncbi:MAG: hypothetical protein KatS3mg056_1067 [Chloroflexus sp.]|nr:MAG: hypothetical protein KatS3mg056_1067 [Chloroflexus sp.]